jgi:uncharacterized protein (TIGR02145 family)
MKTVKFMLIFYCFFLGALVSCDTKGPFDYFEDSSSNGESSDDDDNDDNDDNDDDDDDDPTGNIEPGNNIGDLGQVVFTYRGIEVMYKTVRLGDGSVWALQNLGAESIATASDDYLSYGDLFQWGRWDDGHQVIVRNQSTGSGDVPAGSSTGVNELPETNNPAGLGSGSPLFYYKAFWWKDTQNATVLASNPDEVSETNGCDPCKVVGEGWRLPTKAEWDAVIVNSNGILGEIGISDANPITTSSAFVSILKLPAPGFRVHNTGKLNSLGTRSMYWCSDGFWNSAQSVGQAYCVSIAATSSSTSASYRGYGFSVRCMKGNE